MVLKHKESADILHASSLEMKQMSDRGVTVEPHPVELDRTLLAFSCPPTSREEHCQVPSDAGEDANKIVRLVKEAHCLWLEIQRYIVYQAAPRNYFFELPNIGADVFKILKSISAFTYVRTKTVQR